MKANEMFKKLGYKYKEANMFGYFVEYTKKEKDGELCISIMKEPEISVFIRKYTKENEYPEAIYGDELEAIYKKIQEIKGE